MYLYTHYLRNADLCVLIVTTAQPGTRWILQRNLCWWWRWWKMLSYLFNDLHFAQSSCETSENNRNKNAIQSSDAEISSSYPKFNQHTQTYTRALWHRSWRCSC